MSHDNFDFRNYKKTFSKKFKLLFFIKNAFLWKSKDLNYLRFAQVFILI